MKDYKIGDSIWHLKNGVVTSDKVFAVGCSPTLGIFYNKTILAKDAYANLGELIDEIGDNDNDV